MTSGTLTSCSPLSISPALITIGPLTAYSTAFTCGFRVAMVSVFSRMVMGCPVSTVASAVLNRFSPYCSGGPCVWNRACCHACLESDVVRRGTCEERHIKCLRRCMFPQARPDGLSIKTAGCYWQYVGFKVITERENAPKYKNAGFADSLSTRFSVRLN